MHTSQAEIKWSHFLEIYHHNNPIKMAIQYLEKATKYSSDNEKDVQQALLELHGITKPGWNFKPAGRNNEQSTGTAIFIKLEPHSTAISHYVLSSQLSYSFFTQILRARPHHSSGTSQLVRFFNANYSDDDLKSDFIRAEVDKKTRLE
jgi:hypothetical protein